MTKAQFKKFLMYKKFFVWRDEERHNLIKVLCVLFNKPKWYLNSEAPFIYVNVYNSTFELDYSPGTFCHRCNDTKESASKIIDIAKNIHIPFKNQEEVIKALNEYGCWIYFKYNLPTEKPQRYYMIVGYDNSSVTICDQSEVKTISFNELVENYYFRSNDENCGISVNLLEEELK